MTQPATFDPARTAVIIMDFQNGIVNTIATDPEGVVRRAAQALQGARARGIPVIYVVHHGGRFAAPGPDVEICPGVAPTPADAVLVKTKAGSFSTTGLDVMLREGGRDTLVLFGVATSGCVLSTLRWGADINYQLAVLSDACDDRDPEVHRVLTEKIYPRQATVLTVQQFLDALGQGGE
ncbi:MAG: cysteine hydrolase [Chloroflexi bacterium]|nr:cysteine hydrolase [Chloroflexota bacterium]